MFEREPHGFFSFPFAKGLGDARLAIFNFLANFDAGATPDVNTQRGTSTEQKRDGDVDGGVGARARAPPLSRTESKGADVVALLPIDAAVGVSGLPLAAGPRAGSVAASARVSEIQMSTPRASDLRPPPSAALLPPLAVPNPSN